MYEFESTLVQLATSDHSRMVKHLLAIQRAARSAIEKYFSSKVDLKPKRETSKCHDGKQVIKTLYSPAMKRKMMEFVYPFRTYPSKYDEGAEFLDVICQTMKEFDTVDEYVHEVIESPETIDLKNFDEVDKLLETFNHAAINRAKLVVGYVPQPASRELLTRICNISYNRAIDNAALLNNYKVGSSYVYGEITIDCFQKILDVIQPNERDIFVDLGSGVGHLVTYVAGATPVRKAVGIEKAQVPAGYAVKLAEEFRSWMRWFGKLVRPFMLYEGDFLDAKFRDLITKKATIIFINNLAFTPDLDEKIKSELINELQDGTLIITTKNYGRNDRITDRSVNDVSSILDVSMVGIYKEACSWTETTLTFYLHKVNRSKLEEYIASKKQVLPEVADSNAEEDVFTALQDVNERKRKACCIETDGESQTPGIASRISWEQPTLTPLITEAFVFSKTSKDFNFYPQQKKLKPRPQ